MELIAGVTYRVEEAGRYLLPFPFVLLTRKGFDRISREEEVLSLTFVDVSTGQETTLEGSHTLEGLVPVLPQGASLVSPQVRALATQLVSAPLADRIKATATLAPSQDEWVLALLWNQALYDVEKFVTPAPEEVSVRSTVHKLWAQGNPAGVRYVEEGLRAGSIPPLPVTRRFLAAAKSLYFFDTLAAELTSEDANQRRAALEEVALIGRKELLPLVEPLANDDNPSVAIKAAYAIRQLMLS